MSGIKTVEEVREAIRHSLEELAYRERPPKLMMVCSILSRLGTPVMVSERKAGECDCLQINSEKMRGFICDQGNYVTQRCVFRVLKGDDLD